MKKGTILTLSALGLLLAGGIYLGTRNKTSGEKRAEIKQAVEETTGEENAAKVDNMSDEEVNTVYDTIGPGGGGGGGGSSSSSSAPSSSSSAASTTTATKPKFSVKTMGPVVKSPTLQTKGSASAASTVKKATGMFPSKMMTASKAVVTKRGVGSVDATDCVAILKKYGIM